MTLKALMKTRQLRSNGSAAGDALTAFEKRTGSKVVASGNFKRQIATAKKQRQIDQKKDKKN